jgi:hypothetical protein
VAIRRTTRVKDRSGVLLEDLGVVPDATHRMTRNDVLNGNPDLIAAAGKLLFEGNVKVRSLMGTLDRSQPGAIRVQVKAANVDRVDAYSPVGQPLGTVNVAGGTATLLLNPQRVGQGRLELRGFDLEPLA